MVLKIRCRYWSHYPGRSTGIWQMESALESWGVDHFDLLYVHNLVAWAS